MSWTSWDRCPPGRALSEADPEIARQVGRAVAEVRKYSKEFEREIREAVEPIEREVRDAESQARKAYQLDDDFSTFKPKPEPPPPE